MVSPVHAQKVIIFLKNDLDFDNLGRDLSLLTEQHLIDFKTTAATLCFFL